MKLRFICNKCHRKQKLDRGVVWAVIKKNLTDPEKFYTQKKLNVDFVGLMQ